MLLLLAFVSVPWMLLPKPFLLKKQHEVCSFKLYCVICLFNIGGVCCVCVFVWVGFGFVICLFNNVIFTFSSIVFLSGSKERPMHPFQNQRSLCNQGQTMMIPTVMQSLNSVKFLCISSYTQSSLSSVLFQILLLISVCGRSGMYIFSQAWNNLE